MAEGYRKPSLTPEMKAERARYAKEWRRHARVSLGARWYPFVLLATIVAAFVGFRTWLPLGVAAIVLVAVLSALGLFLWRSFSCPRCTGLWQLRKGGKIETVCPECGLRVGQLPGPGGE